MKLNIRKAMTTLALAGTLILNKNNVHAESIEFVNNDYHLTQINSEIQDNSDFQNGTSDYFITAVSSQIRKENSFDSEGIAKIDKGELVYKILSYDDWYLVKYNDVIGYFCADYLEPLNIYDDIEYYKVNDIVETTSKINFRLGPSVDDKRITTINKGEKLKTIAKTSNNWYLVNYNNQIGYISGEYIISLLENINNLYPEISLNEIKVQKLVYVNGTSLNIRDSQDLNGEKVGSLGKYECVKVLKEFSEWYFIVNNDGIMGYINKLFTKDIDELYVVIDLSDQRLWLYDGKDVLIETDVVTGKLDTPTRIGLFKIYNKQTNRYLTGEDYNSYVNYWMPFDGGIGLHDASWRKKFGNEIYINDGSHGCVNMPKNITDDIYETVSIGTKVLVHK